MLVTCGIVWGLVLLGSVAAGPVALAVVVTPVAVLAVLTAWRATAPAPRSDGNATTRPRLPSGPRLWGLLALGAAPLFALAGIVGLVVVTAAGAAVVARWPGADGSRPGPRRIATVALPVLAAGFLVLASRQGTELVVVMVLAVLAFDIANAVMGRTLSGGLVGAIFGAVTVLVLSVIVDALLDPPFTGNSSYVLCALVAVLAPLGVHLCRRLVPGRVPAVRRLDALVVAAPAWWLGVVVLLHS